MISDCSGTTDLLPDPLNIGSLGSSRRTSNEGKAHYFEVPVGEVRSYQWAIWIFLAAVVTDWRIQGTTDFRNLRYQIGVTNPDQGKNSSLKPLPITAIDYTVHAKDVLLTANSTMLFVSLSEIDSEAL